MIGGERCPATPRRFSLLVSSSGPCHNDELLNRLYTTLLASWTPSVRKCPTQWHPKKRQAAPSQPRKALFALIGRQRKVVGRKVVFAPEGATATP